MRRALLTPAGAILLVLAGCGPSGVPAHSAGRLPVVAAESSWGSIARQLGGDRVAVQSIIVNPNTDPHAYEPTAADAIALARSRMALLVGLGYDPWASRLLAANPSKSRVVLDVGDLLDLHQGENPHQWYSPSSVRRVIEQIAADYQRLDPKHASYFRSRRVTYETRALARYNRLIANIRARYAGVPVGYSESIFQPLGRALGLKLLTPAGFANDIAEGTDVTVADEQTVERQAQRREIKAWVYNSQNVTPDVQRVNQIVRSAGIPIVTITETLDPASATFQRWQVTQLRRLQAALHEATGR